jgi:hypothetical protein
MQRMFQTAQAKARPKVAVDDASADALLDDILGGLDGAGSAPPIAFTTKCVGGLHAGLGGVRCM